MEYYQAGNIDYAYGGSYLLCIPLCVLLVTDLIAEYLAAVRVILIKTPLNYMKKCMTILMILLFFIYMNMKLSINIITVIFDRFLLVFFFYDKISIIRSILSVRHISEVKAHPLIEVVTHKLLFEAVISIVEIWSYFSLITNRSRRWVLLIYVPIYILLMKLSDMDLKKRYYEIIGGKKSSPSLKQEENDRWQSFIGDFVRFNLFVGLTHIFLFLDFEHQYVSLIGIVLFSSRSLMRTMNLSTFLFMVDHIRKEV